MNTQNRNNFLWRPNDNSPTTKTRYQLEANHWLEAFTASASKGASNVSNYSADLNAIGLFISVFFMFITLVLYGLIEVVKFIFRIGSKVTAKETQRDKDRKKYDIIKKSFETNKFNFPEPKEI